MMIVSILMSIVTSQIYNDASAMNRPTWASVVNVSDMPDQLFLSFAMHQQ
jgi:hypothetical protein